MLRQDETDKPLIAIWIPEAMEWSMLGSNTEEEEGVWTHTHTHSLTSKTLEQNNTYLNSHKLFI